MDDYDFDDGVEYPYWSPHDGWDEFVDEAEYHTDSYWEDYPEPEETEWERRFNEATDWQRICMTEPNYIKRVKKLIAHKLERHCVQYVGKVHMAQHRKEPKPTSVIEDKVFRIASWVEFRVRDWRK